jgi:hypothetical protein
LETNDFWDIPFVPDAKPERKQRQPGEPSGDGTMAKLYTRHPEGGGPYGGRDNALTAYIGYLRSTGIDYDSAYPAAVAWNLQWCDPPMDEADVAFKAGRAWSDWPESDREPLTPAMLREQLAAKIPPKRKLEFMNWQQFCDAAALADDAQWLVENFITRGGMHFITAPPGGGKSWIAVDLVRACSDGSLWMGSLPATKCKVLYINEEMGIGRFWQRFFQLCANGAENVHVMQKQMVKLDNPEHLADIVAYVKEHQIAIVILDTFVRVHGYDENSNTDMAKLYDQMKGINESGAAIVALHHHKKGIHAGPVAHEAMRGAGEIAAQADLVATVDHKDGIYTMKTTKQRHIGEEDFVEVSYKIVTNEDGSIVLQHCTGGAEAEREQQYIERVLNALDQNDKMSGNALAAVIGNNKQVALKFLDSMRDMGLIRKVDPAYARSPWVKVG